MNYIDIVVKFVEGKKSEAKKAYLSLTNKEVAQFVLYCRKKDFTLILPHEFDAMFQFFSE